MPRRDDWRYVERDVLAHHGMSRNTQEVLVRTGRQVGKTTAMRCFSAAMLLSVPDLVIAVCGPRLEHGKSILGPVKSTVKELLVGLRAQGEEWHIEVDNMTEFAITCVGRDGTRNLRSIKAYPGNETVSSGVKALFCCLIWGSMSDGACCSRFVGLIPFFVGREQIYGVPKHASQF